MFFPTVREARRRNPPFKFTVLRSPSLSLDRKSSIFFFMFFGSSHSQPWRVWRAVVPALASILSISPRWCSVVCFLQVLGASCERSRIFLWCSVVSASKVRSLEPLLRDLFCVFLVLTLIRTKITWRVATFFLVFVFSSFFFFFTFTELGCPVSILDLVNV